MAWTRGGILDRISSLVADVPFRLTLSRVPFDFDRQPAGVIDGSYRVVIEAQEVIGGFGYTEDRTDALTIYVAKTVSGEPTRAYRTTIQQLSSIHAAVVRDGAAGGGDYAVRDGDTMDITYDAGSSYLVGRLMLPINYDAEL